MNEPSSPPICEAHGASDVGLVRLNNEDVFAKLSKENFFILADGMGGRNAGEVAANACVVERFRKRCDVFWRCYWDKWVTGQDPVSV